MKRDVFEFLNSLPLFDFMAAGQREELEIFR